MNVCIPVCLTLLSKVMYFSCGSNFYKIISEINVTLKLSYLHNFRIFLFEHFNSIFQMYIFIRNQNNHFNCDIHYKRAITG